MGPGRSWLSLGAPSSALLEVLVQVLRREPGESGEREGTSDGLRGVGPATAAQRECPADVEREAPRAVEQVRQLRSLGRSLPLHDRLPHGLEDPVVTNELDQPVRRQGVDDKTAQRIRTCCAHQLSSLVTGAFGSTHCRLRQPSGPASVAWNAGVGGSSGEREWQLTVTAPAWKAGRAATARSVTRGTTSRMCWCALPAASRVPSMRWHG